MMRAAPLLLAAALSAADQPAPPPAGGKNLLNVDGLEGIAVRPHLAVGWSHASQDGFRSALSGLAGMRLLASPTGRTWIGAEVSWLGHDNAMGGGIPRNALLAGLVIEQQFARQFHLAIGSLGMVGIERHSQNAPDFLFEIGWQPPNLFGAATPLVSYRSDLILSQPIVTSRFLTLGLGWRW